MTKVGTHPIVVSYKTNKDNRIFCQEVIEYIKAERNEKVLLVGRWSTAFDNDFVGTCEGTIENVRTLHSVGCEVYFMCEVPRFSFNVPDTMAYYAEYNLDYSELEMSMEQYDYQRHQMSSSLLPLLLAEGAKILDPGLEMIRSIRPETYSHRAIHTVLVRQMIIT